MYMLTLLGLVGFFTLSAQPTFFKVTIENVGQSFPFVQSGVFNTPVGADAPGPIFPGDAYSFTFDAAPGHYLSFATMFVQSNDLFFAPDEAGVALYDEMGNPISGDLTGQLQLWDSGSEVNEAPGEGPNQAPRQSGPDTGDADPDNTVRLVNDGFSYPACEKVIRFTLAHNGGTSFTATIENVSTGETLSLSDGSMVAVPLSPGVFVVHTDPAPLFTVGEADRGEGLAAIAEDGDPSALAEVVAAKTGVTAILAPGVFVLSSDDNPLFTEGEVDRGEGLEAIAEDGSPGMLADILANSATSTGGAFAVPVGASGPGPLLPGRAYDFVVASGPAGKLSFATMFVQSNDLFYAPDGMGIALFDESGNPISGDVTDQVDLWDAGTELNEVPGIGLNQAPRQSGPDTGDADSDMSVRLVNDSYVYPSDESVIRVTVTPLESTQFTVRVENVSTAETLDTGDGTVPVPLSPGVWALHTTPAPLFTVGAPDRGFGLEAIAEDGDPGMLDAVLAGKMGTPSGAFAVPVGGENPAPAFPGEAYEFTITAAPGVYLNLATMFVQSNDLFLGPGENGIALFDDNGNPISGDVTNLVELWDAGTELNEQPGVGANQAPRQSGPNTGDEDPDNTVRLVNDGFMYPTNEEVIRVTINPVVESGTARLQVIHAADAQTVNVLVNGDLLVPNFAFKTATPYIDVPANTPLNIELVPVGNSSAESVAFEVNLDADVTYVAAAVGTFDPNDEYPVMPALFAPAIETADNGMVAISFLHATPGAPNVDVAYNASGLFSDIAYGTFADYSVVAAEDYQIGIDAAGTGLGSFESSLGFWQGRSAVIFTTGNPANGNFIPWVALSNGGTFPMSVLSNLVGNAPEIAGLQTTASIEVNELATFPNPAVNTNTLIYRTEKASNVNIQLVDTHGKTVRSIFNGASVAGINQVTTNLGDLPKGLYFYTIQSDQNVRTLKLLVQ